MWVHNLPDGFQGKSSFLERPRAKVSRIGVSGASFSAPLPDPGAKGATPWFM